MITLTTNPDQTAGTLIGPPDTQVYAVVGFDGSASALRALDAASRLLNDRPGGMEIVYVAHLSALAAAADVAAVPRPRCCRAWTMRPASCPGRSTPICRPPTAGAQRSTGTSSAVTARSRTS
jgi:hypothetical protein